MDPNGHDLSKQQTNAEYLAQYRIDHLEEYGYPDTQDDESLYLLFVMSRFQFMRFRYNLQRDKRGQKHTRWAPPKQILAEYSYNKV